ncbi:MAG: hypothetical protein WBI36_05100, partial [Erysipelotrichaceae bacterium]
QICVHKIFIFDTFTNTQKVILFIIIGRSSINYTDDTAKASIIKCVHFKNFILTMCSTRKKFFTFIIITNV